MPPFKYAPVVTRAGTSRQEGETQRFEIRLLRIQPSAFTDDIHIDLQPKELDLSDPIEYEALSYTWGTTKSSVLYIGESKHTLEVTDNLAIALRHLRYPTEWRTMWIDAICIDQSNLDECSEQVAIMADIYRLAKGVVVWLGPQSNYSNYALDILRDLAPKVEWDSNGGVDMAESEDKTWRGLREYEHMLLLDLFNRPWFDRLWIRQEIFFSSDKATVQVGHASIPWDHLSKATIFLWGKIVLHPDLAKRLTSLNELLSTCGASLHILRRIFGHSLCSNPRDRLYAVMHMLPDEQRRFIGTPDYKLDTLEIWKRTTIAYIRYYQEVGPQAMSLTILDECFAREPFDTPSWIPKWEVDKERDHHRSLPFFGTAGGPFCSKTTYPESNILRILGVHVQSVDRVYPTEPSKPWPWMVKELFDDLDVEEEHPTKDHPIIACALTLTAGYIREAYDPPRTDLPGLSEFIEDLVDIFSSDEDELDEWVHLNKGRTHYNVVSDCLAGCALITTNNGYVGLAPLLTRPGDSIIAFVGRHSLTVIRETFPDSPKYLLMGQCFIHGFMANEAFLGPLPRGHRFVGRTLPDDNYQFIEMYDPHTKSYLRTDPRFELLALNAMEQEKFQEAVEKRTPYTFDWDLDRFRNAGINAEYFDIV